jgi:hypothetical protein
MAGAPYGNKNAEKWTLRKATMLFNDAIDLSNEIETYYIKVNDKAVEVRGYTYDFIGEIARELGTFHEIFEHLAKRFPALQRLRNELNNNIQSNCYSNTKKGIIREATGIVNLKSNWKWRDRADVTSDDKEIKVIPTTIVFTKPTNEQ